MGAAWRLLMVAAALQVSCDEPRPEAAGEVEKPRPVVTAVARATVVTLTGEVAVKRAAGDDWRPASEDMKLFENDKLRTARGATAQLRFTNGSNLTLGEDALIGIAEARPRPGVEASDVTVIKGRIDAELQDPSAQSLVVTTPSATVRAGREIVFQ